MGKDEPPEEQDEELKQEWDRVNSDYPSCQQ